MKFQLSYFKSLKMLLLKCCTQCISKFGKLRSGHRTTKGQFSFQSQRSESHSIVSDLLRLHGQNNPWNSLGQRTGVGSLSLLQGIFPTQGPNPGLPHYRWILYQLSHKGRSINQKILSNPKEREWQRIFKLP